VYNTLTMATVLTRCVSSPWW